MDTLHAIVLGVIQGFSEFLPISSSGHLAIAQWLFGWDDFEGNDTLQTSFSVAVHLGTLLAVIAYFRKDLVRITRAGIVAGIHRDGRAGPDGRLAWLLALSAVPAAVIGGLFNSSFEGLVDETCEGSLDSGGLEYREPH